LLDTKNPRIDEVVDKDGALRQIIETQQAKIVNLARDIAMNGINPSDLPIVMLAKEPGYFVVLEGNRRLAALKLLSDPKFVDVLSNSKLKEHINNIRKEFPEFKLSGIECFVVSSREQAEHWIKLRHTGENKGIGIVPWDAEASARFSERMGSSTFNSASLQVIEIIRRSKEVGDVIKTQIEDVKLTNLSRLMNDPDVRTALGIRVKDKMVDVDLSQAKTRQMLEKIVDDLTASDFNVHAIYKKGDRLKYISGVESFVAGASASTQSEDGEASGSASSKENAANKTDGDANKDSNSDRQNEAAKTERSVRPSHLRTCLIPTSTTIKIRHPRLNKIYHELKKLDVDDFTNCAAVMLRVFIELSIDEYGKSKTISAYSEKSSLANKLIAVADYFEKHSMMDAKSLKAIKTEAKNPVSLFSIDTLNAYVHNPRFQPKAVDVKVIWDNFEEFIIKLWS